MSNGEVRDFQADLRIDRNNLQEEVASQPSLYAYWAARAEEAEHNLEHLKLQTEIMSANLDKEARAAFNAEGKEKPTIEQIANRIKRDPRWQAQQNALLEAKRQLGICRAAERACYQRKDMLWCLVQLQNREYGHQLAIRKEQVGREG